jgi:hypothetical protein
MLVEHAPSPSASQVTRPPVLLSARSGWIDCVWMTPHQKAV